MRHPHLEPLRYSAAAACAAVVLFSASLPARAAQPNAGALIKKMVALYQAADTVFERSEAKYSTRGTEFVQTNTLQLKKPNYFAAVAQDPVQGTIALNSDGRTVTVYSGVQAAFARCNASPGFADTARYCTGLGFDVFGIQSTQVANPFSFWISRGRALEIQDFKYLGVKNQAGRRCWVVASHFTPAFAHKLVPINTSVARRDATLYIDCANYQLLRSQIWVSWSAKTNGRIVTDFMKIDESHRDIRLNAPASERDFRFFAPKGAHEVFQGRR